MIKRLSGLLLTLVLLPAWALDKALVDQLAKLPTKEELKVDCYHLSIVQDGKILPMVNRRVKLHRKPFSIVMVSKGPSGALIHFSSLPRDFQLMLNGKRPTFPMGSEGAVYPGKWSFPPDFDIVVDDDLESPGVQYFAHNNDLESEFHELHKRGKLEICVRHVKQFFIASKNKNQPIHKSQFKQLYMIPFSGKQKLFAGEMGLRHVPLPSFRVLEFRD